MCGITGFWNLNRQDSTAHLKTMVQQMSDVLNHRGPDDQGCWVDPEVGIALGHRRLAILELSCEGHQPMMSAEGRYVVAFNGEIYNFLELRHTLERLGHRFRGHSDTEVMLASFSQWGVWQATERFNGMFAFAVWDRQDYLLHLGRDRLGEKPLYYGWFGQTLLFGSELKALKVHPQCRTEINRSVLALFLQQNYVPAPYSIYQDIYKLPPATLLTWNGTDHAEPIAYWSAKEAAQTGLAQPFLGSEQDAIVELETLLQDAIGMRMISDVPLGAFLSGGIDSSTVVALMQSQSRHPVKTFTVGFYEERYNEAQHAKAVAHHLGTDHTELYVTSNEAMAVVPTLPTLYDEPFSDPSQIPTFLISQLAKQEVTVCLSGDGGDELFAGYTRYLKSRNIWRVIGWMPHSLRRVAAQSIVSCSSGSQSHRFKQIHALLPDWLLKPNLGNKLQTLAEFLSLPDAEATYMHLMSHWKAAENLVVGFSSLKCGSNHGHWIQLKEHIHSMMCFDILTYLPDDILVKVDRASMGVSLEARVPLLDHRVVEFAWRLPLSMNLQSNQGKQLLRQVLYKYVPQSLVERPKMGFGVPIGSWLRGPLREWADALLDDRRLRREGFLHPHPIRQKWAEHLSGDRDWQYPLWDVLMFQSWLAENL